MRAPRLALLLVALTGCTYDYARLQEGVPFDAGPPPPDTGPRCASDDECEDGVWCNGQGRCKPGDPLADELGCVPGIPRCTVTGECNEADQQCGSGCPDGDGDGYEPTYCGGDDCDDDDPRRNPGGAERCDLDGLDEDCDPSTFGVLDADGDTYPDAMCCNGDFCGSDCDDNRDDVHPDLDEVCDERDNDCDGMTDEGVQTLYYRDADNDGYGAPAPTTLACSRPTGYQTTSNDCDDGEPGVRPGLAETCGNMRDDNCNGQTDEGC